MEHIKLTPGNVLLIGGVAVVCYGTFGAVLEYTATKTNIPVVTALAKGARQFAGWSFKNVNG